MLRSCAAGQREDLTYRRFDTVTVILFAVNKAKDPERLLADALRAQARSAPAVGPASDALPPRYGLLSGAEAGSLERERAALEQRPVKAAPAKRASGQLPAYWVLLLSVLLGLATGSVIGLITLI